MLDRQPSGKGVAQRDVEHGLAGQDAVVADPDAHGVVKLLLGAVADDVDEAGGGVAAKERALRSAQDLHAVDIQKVEHIALRTGEVNTVHVDADLLVMGRRPVHLPDAAHEYLGGVFRGCGLLKV